MKWLLFIAWLVVFPHSLQAATTSDSPSIREKIGFKSDQPQLPGVTLAEGISQVTGVAISPLLGVSTIGAWTYYRAEPAQRPQLPWLCQPWAWGTGFAFLAALFLGQRAPEPFKSPFKHLETAEDKLSALIASSAFIPFIVNQFSIHQKAISPESSSLFTLDLPLASLTTPALASISSHWLLMPIAFAGFFVIWIVSHAFTVLIALCPFPFIDSILKSIRLSFLGSLGVLYAINPILAAVVSVLLLILCAFLAPWAFRFSVFGSIFSTDFFTSLFFKRPIHQAIAYGFLARSFPNGFKARSFGKFMRCPNDGLVFCHRRLFFGPERRLALHQDGVYFIEKGFPAPSLQHQTSPESRGLTLIHLLPRYRHCTDVLAEQFDLTCQDAPIIRGLRAGFQWIKAQLSKTRQLLPQAR